MQTAKPFKLTADEVHLLKKHNFICYRKMKGGKYPPSAKFVALKSCDPDYEKNRLEFIVLVDSQQFHVVYDCAYGSVGSLLWVKEPYYLFTNDKTRAKRVIYTDESLPVLEGYHRTYYKAARMPISYSRKLLRIKNIGVVVNSSGAPYWKLVMETARKK